MRKKEQALAFKTYLNDTRAGRFPLERHPLASTDENSASAYLEILGVLYHYLDAPNQDQLDFMYRLMATAQKSGVQHPVMHYLYLHEQDPLTPAQYENFVSRMTGQLRLFFAVDALLLLRLGKNDPSEMQLLADILESLKITISEAKLLASVCVTVLEQNQANLQYILLKEGPDLSAFNAYVVDSDTTQICDGPLGSFYFSCTNQHLPQATKWNDEEDEFITNCRLWEDKQLLHFKNCDFRLDTFALRFHNIQKIRFENCTFRGTRENQKFSTPYQTFFREHPINSSTDTIKYPVSYNYLNFNYCPDIEILGCTFVGFDCSPIVMKKGCPSIAVENSKFINCIEPLPTLRGIFDRDWEYWVKNSSAMNPKIYSAENEKTALSLNKCAFDNCGMRAMPKPSNHWGNELSCLISNCATTATDCTYTECYAHDGDNFCNGWAFQAHSMDKNSNSTKDSLSKEQYEQLETTELISRDPTNASEHPL